MGKKIVLEQILTLMRENDVSVKEIMDYSGTAYDAADFDLLCEIGTAQIRLPFNEGKTRNPVGIFPFREDCRYIALDETPESSREYVAENRLPSEAFCDKLYTVRKQLNEILQSLKKPVIAGDYFAIGQKLKSCNWIVNFDDNDKASLSSDYFANDKRAKVRYAGMLCFAANFSNFQGIH